MRREMKDRAAVAPARTHVPPAFFAASRWMARALLVFIVSGGAHAQPARDLVSDAVGATAGVFRVDESGQATYSISIAVPPGTAGVAPTLSLDYSSQGATGVLGKGWSLGGQSSIGRCRKTREAGDYLVPAGFGFPASNPFVTAPSVGFDNGDVFCLDGQRLLLVSGVYGANNAVYRPELDPWTRITSKNGNNSADPATYTGPLYFTVERKDGSISEYGNSADARIERNQCGGVTGLACAVSAWALNRVEDSTGNYLTYHYRKFLNGTETTSGTGSDEYVLSEVRYTGKRVLPGQSGSASGPYARVLFDYSADTVFQQRGWQSGSQVAQTRRLNWIKVQDPYAGTPRTVRYYGLTYAATGSNSNLRWLASVQECNKGPGDTGVDTAQVCYPATTFTESTTKYQFDAQADSDIALDVSDRRGARYADVDGDGRLDLVWIRNTGETTCKSRIYVSYGDRIESGGVSRLTLATPSQQGICVQQVVSEYIETWQVFDYDGDGKDDLLVFDGTGGWKIHGAASARPTSSGTPAFDTGTDLLGGISLGLLTRLVDLNGDGLLDVVYAVEDPLQPLVYELRSRLRERHEASPGVHGLRFGSEGMVQMRFAPTDPCSWEYTGTPRPTTCHYTLPVFSPGKLIASEFDGDGRGDLMFEVSRSYDTPREGEEVEIRFLLPEQMDALRAGRGASPAGYSFQDYWYFFVGRTDQYVVSFESYDSLRMHESGTGEMPADIRHIQFGDFNGDSLTDLVYRVPSVSNGQTWRLRLNTGKGFSTASYDATGIVNPDIVQVADVNGDGRADLLYPPTTNTCGPGDASNGGRPFCVRYGQAGSNSLAVARHVPGAGALATSNPFEHEHFFADFDGDGATDYVRFKRANSTPKLFTSRSSTRHRARDVVTRITDGIGAITDIHYQPLTNAGVYRRDTGALTAAATNGRGSPTFDLLAPMYVVARAGSSAPTYDDSAAMAEVGYRYAGAKLQSGGRGFLGFREIATFDGVHDATPARHIVSHTAYRQDFPFVGSPHLTEKRVVASALSYGSTAINVCRNDPEVTGQNCFYSVGTTWPTPTGTKISGSVNVWACQGTGNGTTCPIPDNPIRQACIDLSEAATTAEFNPLGTQQPIFPYLTGSSEESNAYNTAASGNGNWLTTALSTFCYEDTFGNLTYSKVEHRDSANTPISVQVTENAYTNDSAAWRLGRLTDSVVQSSADCAINPGQGTVCSNWKTRTSGFDYDTASTAKTGLLTQEKLQPGGGAAQELRTLHTLDHYGNRTWSFQCSAFEADGTPLTDAECKTPGRVSHRPPGQPGEITAVHRYARTAYDAIGRYATATYVPYYTGATGPTGTVSELASVTINARDEFGNPTQQTQINGTVATARYGALGRPYHAGDNTGASATTTYRWCSSVSCPIDAVYRSQTVSATAGSNQAAPTTWTYFDRLGRPVLTVVQAFSAGVAGQDFAATCSYYDKKTRPERTSEPFFLTTAAVSGAPDFQGGTYDPCGAALWTRNEYDILGRPTKTTLPDSATVTVAYAGLATTTTNAKGQVARETRNALGQVIQTAQANATTPGSLDMVLDLAYDAHGNLTSMTRNAGQGAIVTSYEYDALGRRTKTVDPDRGTERAFYNAAGEVIRTIDGAGMDVRLDIDALGRLWRRQSGRSSGATEPPPLGQIFANGFETPGLPVPGLVVDAWRYDTATNGKGLLHYEERTEEGEDLYRRTMAYDTRGRPSSRATLIDGSAYNESWLYDTLGRTYRETDAGGGTVERTWTARGYEYQLRNATTPSEVYQQITGQNAHGQITNELRGAATLTRSFHAQRGWLTGITATAGATLQNLTYQHDVLGNVTQRRDLRANQTEDFTYDGLNRLRTAVTKVGAAPAVTTLNLTYDRLGNICSKNGAAYTYAGRDGCNGTGTSATASPHAVTQIGSQTFVYGSNGALERDSGSGGAPERWFGYDGLQNLSLVIVGSLFSPSAELNLRYGTGGERYRRTERIGSSTTTTRYVGSVEYITRPTGIIETKRYIGGVMIQTSLSTGGTPTKRYLYQDGLGSIDAITNEAGTLQERLGFDGHGNRRNGDDWRTNLASYTPANTTHGFTGHEHLDPFKLIHMNGRVYDPNIGRFIQADPMLDQGIQGLNRYSYALNNPLTLTDPSGYSSWNKWIRTIAAIVITYYTGGAAANLYAASNTVGAFAVAAAGGFAAGAIQTGTVKGGLYGAFGGAAFFGVGTAFTQANAAWAYNGNQLNSVGMVAKTVSHGVVGGVMSDLQGGKFGHGFASAGATQAISPQIDRIGSAPGRVVAAAALGGTVSSVTGGKFANGAITAAFSRAFNHEAHKRAGVPQSYDQDDPNYHHYDIEGAICSVDAVCTPDSVALANRLHPAPGTFSNTTPVVDGQSSNAQIGWDTQFDDFGPVIHSVSADGMTVRNTTLPGHKLYPGYVERSVFVRNGVVHIRTIGEGIGPMGSMNVSFSRPLWNGLVNSHIRYRVNLGYKP